MIPQAKRGELRGHQQKMYPDHQHIPPSLHLGALTGLGGGSDTLPVPGSHIVRGLQRLHPIPEPPHPSGS